MDTDVITAAVHDAGTFLRADGADLALVECNVKLARVRVALDLTNASCLDCIVPPDLLATMITDSITRQVRGELEVIVDDPRRDPTCDASRIGAHP